MGRVQQSINRVDTASKSAGLSTGRLSNQFAGLAAKIAHVHPVLGNLSNTLLDFAVGGAVTAGVLLGVAAIAVAYDQITKGARKAKEENDKLIASLERTLKLKGFGPGGEAVEQTEAATKRAAELQKQITLMEGLIVRDAMDADVIASNLVIQRKINALVIERQNALNTAAGGQSVINERVNATLKEQPKHIEKTIAKVKELSFSLEQLRVAADEFWGPMRRFNEAFALPSVVGDMTPGAVDISADVKVANEQAKKINDEAAQNAQAIQNAIYQSAQIVSYAVMSAMNVGGGGKGSQLGAQIGMAAGAIGGSFLGPPGAWFGGAVGSIIGSTVGSIGGSLIGGLFDHKKAVDTNTAAVRQNTAALLLNSPSGYKTAGLRYDATEVKDLRRGLQRYATRGGAPALVMP